MITSIYYGLYSSLKSVVYGRLFHKYIWNMGDYQ